MRIKNEYTSGLKRPSRYNPNNFTATGVALFYFVLIFGFFALSYFLKAVGFNDFIADFAGDDTFLLLCVSVFISQAFILLFSLVYSAVKGVNPVSGGGYENRFDFTPILMGCMLIAGIQICFGSLHREFSESASSFGTGVSLITETEGNPLWLFVYIVMLPLLPCICEEITFRGVLMRGLSRYGFFASVVLSSAMFALFHGNTQQILIQFMGGMAIGAGMYITGNFMIGAAMHFFNNLFAVGYSAFIEISAQLGEGVNNVSVVFTTLAGVAMLIIGAYYFANYRKNPDAAENGAGRKPVPVLMSTESRAEYSSIVIDSSQVGEFIKYYPDAMRYKRGGFVNLNREGKSPWLPPVLITLDIVCAVALVVLNQFGI